MARAARPRVVIVGGGFGGLQVVRGLARAPCNVTLLDRKNYHCFQPLLYQVATAALSPADIAWPLRGILRKQANAEVRMAELTAIDTGRREAITDIGSFAYDFLVLATGATHSYFGHPEWEASAPGLKRIPDATAIRHRILLAFERAEAADNGEERRRWMTFVIVGGGPTGVEMAGAIAEVARMTLARDFRRIDTRAARVLLVEAGPRILPAFAEDLSAYAAGALERLGVTVSTGTMVSLCDELGVETNAGRVPAGTVIWAAGVVASPAGRWLSAETDRAGRVIVAPDLSIPGCPGVFVIGDTAAVQSHDGTPVPGIAPAAKQMGDHVAGSIRRTIQGGDKAEPFRYRHQGNLAAIGRNAAVVELKRVRLKGFPAWLFWLLVHIYFLIGTRNRIAVAFAWAWNYVTWQRDARLIT